MYNQEPTFYSSTRIAIPYFWSDMHPDRKRETEQVQRAHQRLQTYKSASGFISMPVNNSKQKGN